MGYIDLHVHSKHSDGNCSVEEILEMAYLNNVTAISLTEHYNLSSLRKAHKLVKSNKRYSNIEIVPGMEIGSSLRCYGISKRHVCHFLAYYVSTRMYSVLNEYEEERKETNERIIEKLKKEGMSISYDKIFSFSKKDSFGRYDIARYIVRLGHAYTPEDAYAKYLDYGRIAHVERRKMPPEELIQKIIKCGGVPVIAHPKSLRLNSRGFRIFIESLVEYGLCGIEINYPRMKKDELEEYREICEEFNLIGTAGSDFHKKSGDVEIGLGINNNLCMDDYSIITRLKERKHYIDFNLK